MTTEEKQFCEELQELLDRYKTRLSVPCIMRNAQRIFHNTLSFRCHPELHHINTIEAFKAEAANRKGEWKWIQEWIEEEK